MTHIWDGKERRKTAIVIWFVVAAFVSWFFFELPGLVRLEPKVEQLTSEVQELGEDFDWSEQAFGKHTAAIEEIQRHLQNRGVRLKKNADVSRNSWATAGGGVSAPPPGYDARSENQVR